MALGIAIVDDHPVFRRGLRALLETEEDLTVVGEAADGAAALALVDAVQPAVVTVDIAFPNEDGLAVAQEMLHRWHRLRVLMLTVHAGTFFVTRALSVGAGGYALKSQTPSEIVDAVRTVGAGRRYLAPQLDHLFVEGAGPRPSSFEDGVPFGDLSKREREVLNLILLGSTNETIARKLVISVKTVETHRSRINRKIGVRSPAELMRIAALRGLLGR